VVSFNRKTVGVSAALIALAAAICAFGVPASAAESPVTVKFYPVVDDHNSVGAAIDGVTAHLYAGREGDPLVEVATVQADGDVISVEVVAAEQLRVRFSRGDEWMPVLAFGGIGEDRFWSGGDDCEFPLEWYLEESGNDFVVGLGSSVTDEACGPRNDAGTFSGTVVDLKPYEQKVAVATLKRLIPGESGDAFWDELMLDSGSAPVQPDGTYSIDGVYADGEYLVEIEVRGDETHSLGDYVSTYLGGRAMPTSWPANIDDSLASAVTVKAGEDSRGNDVVLAQNFEARDDAIEIFLMVLFLIAAAAIVVVAGFVVQRRHRQ
jgi:hypothetical protein